MTLEPAVAVTLTPATVRLKVSPAVLVATVAVIMLPVVASPAEAADTVTEDEVAVPLLVNVIVPVAVLAV